MASTPRRGRPGRPGPNSCAPPAQEEAWFALLFTHASVTVRIDAVLMERYHISFSAFEILCRLKEHEPQPVRSFASQLVSVSPTRASRLMQDLVDAGAPAARR